MSITISEINMIKEKKSERGHELRFFLKDSRYLPDDLLT